MANARWSSADLNRNVKATPTPRSVAQSTPPAPCEALAPVVVPVEAVGGRGGKKNAITPTRLRPLYQVGTYEGFEGKRFVASGLTAEQAQGLQEAAARLGVREVV